MKPIGRALLASQGHNAGEPNDPYYHFRASLRIFGQIADLDAISRELNASPTYTHRFGQRPRPAAAPNSHDMWRYDSSLAETGPLSAHILALWEIARPHVTYLHMLRTQGLVVDVFCGYRSNSDTAGFHIEPDALKMFVELDTPFNVSVIVV